MIEYILGSENFYFSYTYDLTHTLQRLQNTTPEFYSAPLIDRVSCCWLYLTSIKTFLHLNEYTIL